MKSLCEKLTEFVDRTKYTEDIQKLFTKPEFFYDRKIEFLPTCQNLKTKDSWKRLLKYTKTSNRTLRKFIDSRKTRRNK